MSPSRIYVTTICSLLALGAACTSDANSGANGGATPLTPTVDQLRNFAKKDGTLSYLIEPQPVPTPVFIDRTVTVVTSDKSSLSATLYRPDAPGKYPTLVVVTPYARIRIRLRTVRRCSRSTSKTIRASVAWRFRH